MSAQTLKSSGNWSPEFLARLRENEVVTVRCAHCNWSRTGPAFHMSRRGNEVGVLAKQRHHAAVCKERREARNARQRRYYARDRAAGKRRRRREYLRRYYHEHADAINARRRSYRRKGGDE